MLDTLFTLLLRLYPEEFRTRFGPQIEADLYHPDTNKASAIVDILRSALYHRATSPGLYIALTSVLLGGAVVVLSSSLPRQLPLRSGKQEELYIVMFLAVFLVVLSVLILAIHWLRTCSKSKI
jgi:hypothetical protein